MEAKGDLQHSPKLGFEVEFNYEEDAKYVSKYSAILVATIQEAKDKVSQIEYVFCKQLYSHFQLQSKTFRKMYDDKEKDYLLQIEKLRLENREVMEENRCLNLEKESLLSLRERNQLIRINELEEEVKLKSKEIDESLELQNRLLQLVQTKSSMVLDKGKQLKEREERIGELGAKVDDLEREVEELRVEIKEKTKKVAEKKELADGLHKNINFLMKELDNSTPEGEKKEWESKVENLEDSVSKLQKQLGERIQEVEEGNVLRGNLAQQIDTTKMEILRQKKQLEESENEKELLVKKVNGLEQQINELQENMYQTTKVAEGKDLQEILRQKLEARNSQLVAMKKSHRDLFDKYKSLKSQYNYLCAKFGLTEENMLCRDKLVVESGSVMHPQKFQSSPDFESKPTDTSSAAIFEMKKVKVETEASNGLENDKVVKAIPMSSFQSPPPTRIAPKCPLNAKSAPVIGTKRPASRWIETRSHHKRDGRDPRDDFLDTPLENVKETLNKVTKVKVDDYQIPAHKDIQPDSSDDETQDMNAEPAPEKQQMPLPVAGQKPFKYVEPVRKKAERQNLQGVECKQCKKFYDAVLPDGGKGADGNNQNFRCEHHDGVSRHRYKYIPPLTPEGFWNIGFESEM
ncbi:protein gamma response 1 [Mercurialis annua]|uniref:protein gamma response 1 n=1 Tax=Mercurialis annua TaxID=3986 RepID=UPI00215FFA7A|nr:protein gamma response 1 [Mercurialis annua]